MHGAPFPSHHLVLPTDSTPIGIGKCYTFTVHLTKKLQARIFLLVNIEKVVANERRISG